MDIKFEELKDTECPFLWKINKVYAESNLTTKMLSNLEDPTEDSTPFQNFVYLITAVYDTAIFKENAEEAKKLLWKYDLFYNQLIEDDIMKDYSLAFKHILLSMNAYLSRCAKNHGSYDEILEEIPNLGDLDNANRAGLYGTKAAVFFQFGPFESTVAGCELLKKAIELDTEQGEWHFLYGKGLHRQRRIEKKNSLASRQDIESLTGEMKHLELSVDLSPTPSKIVFLAESYADAVEMIFYENKRIPAESDRKYGIYHQMGDRAVELYNNAATNHGKSWYILLRCGMGFMRLPIPFKNHTKAEKHLQEAYNLKQDNGFICHQLSLVCSRTKQFKKAYELAKKAADLGIVSAVLDEVRIGKQLHRRHDVLHSLERNFDKFHAHSRSVLCAHKGLHFFFKRNWDAGLRSFLDAFEVCEKSMLPHFKSLTPYTCPKRNWAAPFSAIIFIDTMLNEIRNRGIPVNDDLVIKLHRILRENYSDALKDTKTLTAVKETLRVIFDE